MSEFNVVALVLARLPLAYGSLKRAVSRTAWARSLTARCSLAQASIHISRKIFSGFTPFPPKNPQFDHFKVPNLIPKMFTGQYILHVISQVHTNYILIHAYTNDSHVKDFTNNISAHNIYNHQSTYMHLTYIITNQQLCT